MVYTDIIAPKAPFWQPKMMSLLFLPRNRFSFMVKSTSAKLRKRESEAEAASINEANQFLSFWRPVEPFQPEIAPDTKPEITPEPVIELQVHETDQEPEPVPVPKYEPYWRNKSGLSIWNEGRNRNDRHNAWYLPCLRDFEMIILGIFRVQLY